MKNKILFCMFLFFIGMSGAWAQGITVTGKVTDYEGLEVIGGNVTVKGTTTGTITDMSGQYTIQVSNPAKAVLVFSYIF